MSQASVEYELRPFQRIYAPLVASWVRDDDELFWLAPQTPGPLTLEKVIGWTAHRGRPMLFWVSGRPEPIGYAELNDLSSKSGELWIGHFILDPSCRGEGLSRHMLRLMSEQAFDVLGAHRVALIVFPDNEPAVRCYRSAGLQSVGWQRKTFPTRPGMHMMLEMAIDRAAYENLPRGSGPAE